ncbi:putative cytochrome P450 [Enhygromyxa salina]|uniref:Putative cytochrome P450 n=1 Tax=Enhygromyxa salina TaxID=215803 RepID=A0A2S9Y7F2_9BACT|nr:cytochrome P450 [Enhygromyxa salina]PRQ01038.1 putative cytochrome P450 [Enhygromyxa salina]
MPKNIKDAPTLSGRWPLFGHLPRLNRDAYRFLRDAARELGPVFWIDLGFGNRTLMVVSEPGFAVFKSKHADSSHLRDFAAFLGKSMLTVDGPDHRRMRTASSHAFTPAGLSRAQIGDTIAETLERRVATWQGQDSVAIVEQTKVIALEVIFRVMGIEVRDLPQWSRWYAEFLLGLIDIPINLPGTPKWRARRARRWLEARVLAIIADARARDDHDSLVGAMVHGKDDQGAGQSESELVDNLLILGFAGHETTASTMAWSMLHLGSSPRRWDRLCEEAAAIGDPPHDYAELMSRAPYALGVFRESLRLYPPVTIDSRRAHTTFELAGYRIEPGTVVGTSFLHLSRDEARYEQPDAWRPERWLDLGHKPTPIENCQFGGGAHFCLGYHMALLEGTMFLVHVARTLSKWGRRPLVEGELPRPTFVPLTRPPAKTRLVLA